MFDNNDTTRQAILEVRGLVKEFLNQRALDSVDFNVYPGEVHALLGENGAGKSTLIKIIAGVYHPDYGDILIDGIKRTISSPKESETLGLGFIYQDLYLVPHLSVAENILLGRYPSNLGLVTRLKLVQQARGIPDALPISFDLRTPVKDLSVIEQWKVAINRAISLKARVIFMDEPTSSLTYEEVKELFNSITHLKSKGTAIVYVTHRIQEIFEIADRVTVLRDGCRVQTESITNLNIALIFQMMVGRKFESLFPPRGNVRTDACLEIRKLCKRGKLENIDLVLHKGEILGLAGLVGSGRTELARAIFGADKKDSGDVIINGKLSKIESPQDAIKHGLSFVPEDRASQGLFRIMDVVQNITMAALKRLEWHKWFKVLSGKKERCIASKAAAKTGLKDLLMRRSIRFLSGGNQQKAVLSRWICAGAQIYILDEPTRGIDVGAKVAIYELVSDLANEGAGIIFISSDLAEVVGISHRILIMERGAIKHELEAKKTNLQEVLDLCIKHKAA